HIFSRRGATHFDTWNEPQYWLKGTPAQVAKVMIETYMNIKAVNPKAKIAAPGLLHSMEYNAKVLRAALREGRKRGIEEHFPFFDIYNIHYGDFPLEDEYVKYIRTHRELLKEFGLPADMPIWNSELGMWYYGGAMKDPKKHDTARYEWDQAKYYVRHCLLGFPEGVTHNLLFTMADLTRVREHSLDAPDADDVSMSNWEPRRAYAAYAVLIDEIDLTDYESTLDLGKNVYAFVFRRADGGRTIALWTFENTSKHPWANRRVKVKLPVKSRNPVVVDFMGTPKILRAGGGSVKIPVDGYPCYLQDPPVKK
ncbi:MAG: hypothetical protein QF662_07150, partial [Phycisphaerae bacterium]|nr:hypothetical protein [Phycisphaerae bacterium]